MIFDFIVLAEVAAVGGAVLNVRIPTWVLATVGTSAFAAFLLAAIHANAIYSENRAPSMFPGLLLVSIVGVMFGFGFAGHWFISHVHVQMQVDQADE
jgi:hypothetical protein